MRFAFIIFLLLPIAGQTYVSWRVWQLLSSILWLRIGVVALMTLAFLTFFVAMSGVIDRWPMPLATATYEVGTSWLMLLLYLFLAFVLMDLLWLCHVLPADWVHANAWMSAGLFVGLVALFTYAYFHYNDKQRVEMTVKTDKVLDRELKFVLVSDLHLGYHNQRAGFGAAFWGFRSYVLWRSSVIADLRDSALSDIRRFCLWASTITTLV